jgi:uncharacterized protein with PIN domain
LLFFRDPGSSAVISVLPMKFIADAMLGRLARELRLLGYDVLYDPALNDNEIIRRGLEEDRMILTRDTGLASRPLARHSLFIRNDHVKEQVRQVLDACRFEGEQRPLTRCSVCNGQLVPVGRDAVRDLVPDYVFGRMRTFMRCGGCGRVYWHGSHMKNREAE